MKNKIKTFQQAAHRHEGVIQNILFAATVILVLVILGNQLESNSRISEERARGVTEVITSVEAENEEQTELINRQFRALCVIIIQTSGQEGLQQLDGQTQERCRNLASNEDIAVTQPTRNAAPQQQITAQAPEQPQPVASPDNTETPVADTPQPEQPPEQPLSLRQVPVIKDILDLLRLPL